jgi:4-amino-4-deoxy-L-arabinose transferase-like glycosyltransferase
MEQIKAAGFPPGMPIDTIRYEFHQPPLYYVLAAPVYSLAGGSLTALRLFSVLLGASIVLLAYGIARRIFPARPTLALGAAAFVAFLPQHLATVSQVGNDVLAELLFAAMLYVLVGWVVADRAGPNEGREGREGRGNLAPTEWMLGLLLGLILITKTTAYIAVPLAGAVLLWRWRRERAAGIAIARDLLAIALPAALIALPWYARNVWAYGWPDILGLRRHDEIVVGQMRTPEFIAQFGTAAYWRRTVEWTLKSFWGVFGWMGVWLDSRFYLLVALLSGTALGGFALRVLPFLARRSVPAAAKCRAAWLLSFSVLLTLLAYAWYNLTFLQHQGRYLFTALIPIALAFAWGWDAALRPRNARLLAGALAVFAVALAAWGVIGPAGLPKWPLALTVALGGALAVVSFIPARLRSLAYAGVFALLPLLAAYALYTGIVGQLWQFGG